MSAHRPAHFTGLVLALVCVLVLGMSSPARADAVLSQQKNCNACHAMDGAITGPSLKAVAQKYASDRAAADKLTTRILKGGVGVWGPVPMPANPQLSEAEARRLAVWILGLKQAQLSAAKQSIALQIETALDAGQSVPPPSTITSLQKQRAYKGWIWAIAEVSPELLSEEIERVNISLPKRVLARLDAKAKAFGETRSGFIAHMTISA